MGHAARAAATAREQAATRPVFWYPCDVCRNLFPSEARANPTCADVRICQRCYMADLARVVRECPERFQFLPSVRALRGLPQVQLQGPA